jgi:hypothetical protein
MEPSFKSAFFIISFYSLFSKVFTRRNSASLSQVKRLDYRDAVLDTNYYFDSS